MTAKFRGRMQTADDLIAMIYAALLGETTWLSFLERLGQELGSEWTTMLLHDSVIGRGAVTLASGVPEPAQHAYLSHYATLNPWIAHVARTPIGIATPGEMFIPASQFRKSEYYSDFLRPNGIETSVGLTIEREEGRNFIISTVSGDASEARNLQRAELLTALAPHLRRASAWYRRHQLSLLSNSLSDRLLATERTALVVINIFGRIVHANASGEALMATGRPLGITPLGRLRTERGPLRDMISAWDPRDETQPSFELDEGDYRISMIRLSHGAETLQLAEPLAAILVSRKTDAGQMFAARYGLTRAEQRSAAALIEGLRPREIAERAGLSIETVRSQLKAVYSKTGVSGQMQFLRLVTSTES